MRSAAEPVAGRRLGGNVWGRVMSFAVILYLVFVPVTIINVFVGGRRVEVSLVLASLLALAWLVGFLRSRIGVGREVEEPEVAQDRPADGKYPEALRPDSADQYGYRDHGQDEREARAEQVPERVAGYRRAGLSRAHSAPGTPVAPPTHVLCC